jgi:hypothetical protein
LSTLEREREKKKKKKKKKRENGAFVVFVFGI